MNPEQPALEPTIIVIFGITGDLSQRYLLPALYHLFKDDLLDEHTEIIGLTRQGLTAEELFGKVELCINEVDNVCDPVALKLIQTKTRLIQFDPNISEDYDKLLSELNSTEERHGLCMNRLYYLSIPPDVFATVVHNMGTAGLNGSCQHGIATTRLLVEKPFGSDLASAKELITKTGEVFKEEQVFRIDHYLAKDAVQAMLAFRLSCSNLADAWNSHNIRQIDIVANEKIGIEGRVNFYEGLGALRDLIQSHLLQLLALVSMELPHQSKDSNSLHAAKQALLAAVAPADPSRAVRGQYTTYRQEVNNPESITETYAKLQLQINNQRWAGVPITIATGKNLAKKRTEVTLTLASGDSSTASSSFVFRIQPVSGIDLTATGDSNGFIASLKSAVTAYKSNHKFNSTSESNAYERVLADAIRGDQSLFVSSEEVLLSWKILEPVVEAWQGNATGMQTYVNSSDGASGSQNLLN